MRRRQADKRESLADPKFSNKLVGKFISILMYEGKRSVAESIIYSAFKTLEEKTQEGSGGAIKAFNKALENVRPRLELKARRVGGATYQIPIEVPASRGNSLAMRWIRDIARKKKGKSMTVKLAEELLSAYKGEGVAVKKRDETHKMAEANKAFAHLRW